MGRTRGTIAFLVSGLAAVSIACGDNENVGPIGDDQVVETDEDTAIDIALAGSDANGDQLEFTIIASPLSGTLSGTAPDVTYTPDENFFGADMFSYAVSDAEKTETFDVTIMVRPVNDGPVITVANAAVTTDEDQPAGPIVVALADIDDDMADLVVEASSANIDVVDAGGIEIDRTTGDAEITLTPVPDASGTAQITVTVTDAAGESANASFSLEVAPVNDAPTISDIADQITQRDPITDVAFTIADVDDQTADLTVTPVSDNQAVVPDTNVTIGGTGADRTISVTPIASGTATITVSVSDGTASAGDVFSFEVTNSAPNAVADTYDGVGNTVLIIASGAGLLANDSDDDAGDSFSIVDPGGAVQTAAGGSVLLNAADGGFTYTPPAGTTGPDSFSYQLTDGFETSTGIATINLSELVWYVDNDVAASGDGRSHLPFATLAEAEGESGPGDIIYVASGDGTSDGYDAGISLEDGQQLIGSGVELVVNGVTLRNAGDNPVITNADGDGIDLADGNVVAGLTINGQSDRGIAGTQITSIEIRNVTVNIADAGGNTAINLNNNNPTGTVTIDITDTIVQGNLNLTPPDPQIGINISVGGGGGAGAVALDLTRNTISEVQDGIVVDLVDTSGTGATANTVSIDNNLVSDFSRAGIDVGINDTAISGVSIISNTINGDSGAVGAGNVSQAAGIEIRAGSDAGGVATFTITGNTVQNCGDEGINLAGSGSGNAGAVTADIDTNTLIANGGEGLRIDVDDAQTFTARLDGNVASANNSGFTFGFGAGTSAELTLLLRNNSDDGTFAFECNEQATDTLTIGGDPAVPGFPRTIACDAAGETALTTELSAQGNSPAAVSLVGSNDITIVDPSTI